MHLGRRGISWGVVGLCSGLGLLVAELISARMPQVYESTAELAFPKSQEAVPFGCCGTLPADHEQLTSRETLAEVVRLTKMDREAGGADAALRHLQAAVVAEVSAGSSGTFVNLRVRAGTATRAKEIADALVLAFGERLRALESAGIQQNLQQVKAALASQQDALEQAAARLAEARDTVKADAAAPPPVLTPPKPPMTEEELQAAGRELAKKLRAPKRAILRIAPTLPTDPLTPNKPRNRILGASGGLLCGLIAVAAAGWMRARRLVRPL